MGKTVMFIIGIIFLLMLAPVAFADCAGDAYGKACASCSFDANGKVDQTCMDNYKSQGTTCVSTKYPLMAAQYAKGNCSQIDTCASELQSCVAQYSSGNDSADCKEGSVAICYASADECTRKAASECGEIQNICKPPAAMVLLVLVGALFYSRR